MSKKRGIGRRLLAATVALAGVCGLASLGACSFVDQATRVQERRLGRSGLHSKQVKLGNDRVRYWEGGSGKETVVLLHGFGADATWQWRPQMQQLAEQYRVIAPDLLWFGQSKSSDNDYSIQHQARAVLRLLDHEGVENFHLIGVSYGGMVSHEIIGRAPERVDRVVLVSSPARAFMAEDKKAVLHDLEVSTVEDLLLPQQPSDLRRLMGLAYWKPRRVPDFIAQGVIERYYQPNREHHLRLLRSVPQNAAEHREMFQAPSQPTLIVWGEHDQVFPTQAGERIHGELAGSTLCVFENAAHAPHLERQEDVTPLMLRFLSGQEVTCDPSTKL